MKKFKDYVNDIIMMGDHEWQVLQQFITIRHYKKGDIISFKDDIWTEILFINTGLIRCYFINEKGKDFTRQLYFNTDESYIGNLFVVDFTSILMQTPSNRAFEVIEDSEVVVLPRDKLYALYDGDKRWERIGRIVAEKAYINMDDFYYHLLTKDATQRYLHLKKVMSGLIEQTPQYHIATYLGITPVSLSRIKKQLKEN